MIEGSNKSIQYGTIPYTIISYQFHDGYGWYWYQLAVQSQIYILVVQSRIFKFRSDCFRFFTNACVHVQQSKGERVHRPLLYCYRLLYFLHTVHSLIRRSSPPSPSPQQHEQHEQHPTILLLKKLLHHWMALHNPHVSPGENPPLRILLLLHRF